ncbi:Fic family protein [Pedobacter cryophilus]|uniref:Fic family protein n=1 Tax=Pedobacter cryophilus TaxID=2571271 RepID=A0A4V5P0Q3_9SPHI|nr:Fic family protein [Pedobacter cryophilus]TKB98913.1 Fic family protein [Pedobacter cryophilus]
MKPPDQITSEILHLISSIAEKIGSINARHLYKAPAELRKSNRIKTIQSSLEIEGNTLSEEQITAILENKRVIAPEKDILEVKNAIEVYENLHYFEFDKLTSLCKAHQLLMKGLIADAGKIRSKSVGIVKGSEVAHLAPPGNLVQSLLNDLFSYLKNDEDLLLIKSCVFHYEFEFIHPFMDGNGRMGRLWQTLILKEYSPVFGFLPIESIIKNKQAEYYNALNKSGHSTPFITFMLQVIDQSLNELIKSQRVTLSGNDRMNIYKDKIGSQSFTRQNYMRSFPDISTATASRDLKDAVDKALLIKQGDKNKTVYQFQ